MALGSIFTSSASGSCNRRAMDTAERRLTSNCGKFLRGQLAGGIDRRARLAHDHIADALRRPCGCSSTVICSVSRLAVPLPMAMCSTPCFAISWPSFGDGLVLLPFAVGGIDHSGVQHLAGTVHDRHLAARADSRGQGPCVTLPLTGGCIRSGFRFRANMSDGALAGPVCQRCAHLPLQRGVDQAVVSILGGGLNKLHGGGAGLHHRARAAAGSASSRSSRTVDLQHFLLLAAVDGEDLVALEDG